MLTLTTYEKEIIMTLSLLYDSREPEARMLKDHIETCCHRRGTELTVTDGADAPLKDCLGCFGCWYKTPGLCVHREDGGDQFLRTLLKADGQIILSRIVFGGYSPRIKSYIDRCLPIVHPYFQKFDGEMHHKPRYRHYPRLLTLGYGAAGPKEEELFKEYTNAHRDNFFDTTPRGTFCYGGEKDALIAWIEQEVIR